MKHTIKNESETKVVVSVTLDATDLDTIKKTTVARLAGKVKVAGFRPGKVPADVAEKNIDQNQLNSEILEDAVNSSAVEAFDAAKLTPLDRPQVTVDKYVPGQELQYSATVEIIPAVKLGDYKKLSAKKDAIKVSDQDVADVLDRLRQSAAVKKDVDRPAELEDEVIMDFVGKDKDGKDVAGATGKDYELKLGSNTFIPGFEEGVIGKKKGDVFDLPLTFPKDYHHKPLAGAKVTFTVTLKNVKELTLPELDDAFATTVGPFQSLAELKTDITRELTEQKEREAVEKLKDSLVEQLVKGSRIPAPHVLIHDQLESIERDFVQNLMYRGMTLDDYLAQQGKTAEQWRNTELHEQAERRVQVGLALAELSKIENIEVSKQELEDRLAEMLKQYGNSPDIAKQLDTPEVRRDLANRVMTEKTVERLVEINTK